MMKYYFSLFLLVICGHSFAENMVTIDDFDPIPLEEEELANRLLSDINPKTGIAVSSAGTLLGLSFTVANTYSVLDYSLNNSESSELQGKIVLTGTLIVSTVIFSLLLDYFISGG